MTNFLKFFAIALTCVCAIGISSCNDTEKVSEYNTASLAVQNGRLVEGEAGEATFAVTTTGIDDGAKGITTWYTASDGTTVEAEPVGITPRIGDLYDNKTTVTMAAGTQAKAGTYYFSVTIDGTISNIVTLTVEAGTPPAPLYTVTVEQVEGGEAAANTAGGTPTTSIEAAEGTQITLTATVDDGYIFTKWVAASGDVTFVDSASNPTTFTMPAGDVTVRAEIVSEPNGDGDSVTILGITWATRNVATPGTFAENPADPGMFYQWNRLTGWSHTDPMSAYGVDGEITGAVWDADSEPGTSWAPENAPCPEGWRVPNMTEIGRLMDDRYITFAWVPATDDAIGGKKFTENSTGKSIFLPAAGRRAAETGELSLVGYEGFYWSSNESNTADHTGAWFLDFTASKVVLQAEPERSLGQSIRCIAE